MVTSKNEPQDSLRQSITPIIDEIIKARSQQDSYKMSAAIANILPEAITQEIENYPQKIARAIAPEIALAIKNQIELDREAIAETLGPEMGQAIKTQIEVERDAMVDALYPVIGNTISKYMVELAQSINDKVENALSIEGMLRKMRAKIKGVSEAELILKESIKFTIQGVLLIQKESGLIISQVQPLNQPLKEVDLFAGMLTAIRSFVNDCNASPESASELHEIDYDDAKIVLEVGGYCYLAVITKGDPPREFINQIRKTLSDIILENGRTIKEFNGDPDEISPSIQTKLEHLIEVSGKPKKSKPPITLIILFLLILTPIGIIFYRGRVAHYWETQTAKALDATPELSIYRLIPQVKNAELTITGRVPNSYLRKQAGDVGSKVAPHLKLNNQVTAIKIPPDPDAITAEVKRLTELFNQTDGVNINTRYQDNSVTVTGLVFNLAEIEKITEAFQKIPGIDKVISTFQTQPHLETRIYFESNSSQFRSVDISAEIKTIQRFLAEHPDVHLKIIGHSDPRGSESSNQALARSRAQAVEQTLIKNKVNPSRLKVYASLRNPPGVMANEPLWLNRCVRFEAFIASE
ncbi:MAG: OmpA family protein [Cyanobacteria bacterium P01_G01_bin.49]